MVKGKKKLIKILIMNFMICNIVQFVLPIDNAKNELTFRYLVSLIFSYCFYKGTEENSIVNPYLLFSLTPLSLMIYSQKVSDYFLLKLKPETWTIAILNMFVFLVGISIALKAKVRIGNYSLFKGKNFIIDELDKDYSVQGIILFMLGQIPKVLSIFNISLPGEQFLSILQFLGIAVIFKSGRKYVAYFMSIIFITLSILTYFNKTDFLMLSILFIVCIESEIYTKKGKNKMIFFIVLISITMVFIVFPLKDYLARGESLSNFFKSDKNYLANQFIDRVEWHGNINFLMPYIYMTTNWTNLQYVLDNFTQHTNGLWFIKPLLGYLQLADKISAYNMLTPYRFAFNTYSFIAVQFLDFGFIFSVVPSLILGLFSGIIYKRYRDYPDSFNCACYALTSVAVFEMFFSNHFFTQSYPFTVIIVAWICSKTLMKVNINKAERYRGVYVKKNN